MAEINSFPNNSDEYIGAEEVMHWLHGRTKGVYAGAGNAAVSAVQNAMQVTVAPGIGWITDADGEGVCWWFDTTQTLDIDQAESTGTLNRIDRIIIEWKTTDYADKPEIKVLKGTNASTATAPALTNSSSLRQISLARVSIPAGTTSLTSLLITDERADTTVCGVVTETVTADTSVIQTQYEAALAELQSAITQAWSGVISDGAITTAKLANNAVTSAKLDASLQNKCLYLTSVAISATTGDIATVSNNAITANHVLTECVFANPGYITTDVTWTTAAGSLTLNGTCGTATTANIVLVKKDN